MKSSSRFGIALIAASVATACIDDPTQLSDDPFPITQEEAAILGLSSFYDGLAAREEADPGDGEVPHPAPAGAPALAPETLTETESLTIPCALGGSVFAEITATGTLDEEADEFELLLALSMTPEDCESARGEGELVTNGYPGVTLELNLATDGDDAIDVSGSLTGGLLIARSVDGPSAICHFDLAIEGVETTAETGLYRIFGTSCGIPVDRTVTADDG